MIGSCSTTAHSSSLMCCQSSWSTCLAYVNYVYTLVGLVYVMKDHLCYAVGKLLCCMAVSSSRDVPARCYVAMPPSELPSRTTISHVTQVFNHKCIEPYSHIVTVEGIGG